MHATQKSVATLAETGAARILRHAADYLERNGWCQETHYATDRDLPPADLIGAMAIAHYGVPQRDLTADIDLDLLRGRDRPFANALAFLGDFIGIHDMTDGHGNPVTFTLTDWNDLPYMAAGCVIAVLRAAADDYHRTGGVA